MGPTKRKGSSLLSSISKSKKPRSNSRKNIKNISKDDIALIKKIDEWTKAAISRERSGEKVFSSKNQADIVSEICGISSREVYYIRKKEGSTKRKERPKTKLDDFNKRALSRLILGFYKRSPPELPTLDKVHRQTKEIPGFPKLGRTKIFEEIKNLGFAYKKRSMKMEIYQRNDIVARRHEVLRDLQDLREAGYKIFYQDETWCNANHTQEYTWKLETDDPDDIIANTKWSGGLNVPSGSGKRLIINHIGSEDGFLENCAEVFEGNKKSADYHHEMNAPHYEYWWEEKVLPALPNQSVVLIDNAKYHTRQTDDSKTPTSQWLKDDIRSWLDKKKIAYTPKDTKPILLMKSKEIVVPKKYALEEITKRYCLKNKKDIYILRLPVGHSELNAIELIWAQVKTEVAKKNTTFKIKDVKSLVTEALSNVSAANWRKAIKHTIKVEDAFRKVDFGENCPLVERVVIDLNDDSESDLDSDDFDSSGDEDEN